MNYTEALDYIHSTYRFGSKLGLENIKYLLSLLGNPHKDLKVLHVAGTNGKGSTSAYLHSVLKAAGYRVGLYTSPYLEEFTERIRINGEEIPREKLGTITALVKEKIGQMVEEGKNHPTEFEVVTAIAFYYYAQEKVDFVVLEVGMGGRMDATNVIEDPLISIITPIGYDHMQYLGNSLEKIAYEKAGIIKAGSTTLIGLQETDIFHVFEEVAREKNNKLYQVNLQCLTVHESNMVEQDFSIRVMEKSFEHIKIGMIGQYQVYNACTALTAIEILRQEKKIKITDGAIYEGFYGARWPGRLEVLRQSPLVILDGAHNAHGANALVKSLKTILNRKKITLVIGMLEDKDVLEVIGNLVPLASKVIATKPDNPRGMEAQVLADKLKDFHSECHVSNTVEDAIEKAYKITEKSGVILFAGSLYMIGEVRKLLK